MIEYGGVGVTQFLGSSQFISILVSLFLGVSVIMIRLRASNKPTSARKIIMPPIGMSTGFLMFVVPMTQIPWMYAVVAFLTGAILFAYPLIKTSKFHRIGDQIYLKRSNMFIVVIVSLLAVRLLLHDVVESYVTLPQSAGIFFILAFGMLLPWRLAMYKQYRQLMNKSEWSAS